MKDGSIVCLRGKNRRKEKEFCMEERRLGQELSRRVKKLTRLGPDAEGDGFTEYSETHAGVEPVSTSPPISTLRVARLSSEIQGSCGKLDVLDWLSEWGGVGLGSARPN